MTAFINSILDFLKNTIANVVDFLPQSPFIFEAPVEFAQIMGYVNYFIPINRMVDIMQVWLVCVGFWYASMTILRWVKIIE